MSSPPLTTSKHDLDQAWYRLIKQIRSGALIGATWNNLLLVDKGGNDATALRNSLTQKFLTVQAALDAAQAGDTVWVGPGFYEENLTWPQLNGVTLRGFGKTATAIIGEVAATISIEPTQTLALLTISDLAITNTDGALAILVDGTDAPESFDPIILENVACFDTSGISIDVANDVKLDRVEVDGALGTVALVTTSRGSATNCRFNCEMLFDYDPAAPVFSDSGPGGYFVMDSCTSNGVVVNNLARIVLSKDTQCTSISASLVDQAVAPNAVGAVWCSGKVIGNVTIQFAMTEQSGEIGRFDYAEIGGLFTMGSIGAGTETERVNMRHAVLHATPVAPAPLHTVGLRSVLDLRGSLFSQTSIVVTNDGAIDRTNWYIEDAAAQGASIDITIDPPYPAGIGTNYTVVTESSNIGNGNIAISAKQADQFTRTKEADATDCRHLLVRPFD